jgi:dienelactone hydrolase
VLTVHGTLDRAINVKDAALFSAALPGSDLKIIEGADHNFTAQEHREALVEAAVGFLTAGGAN